MSSYPKKSPHKVVIYLTENCPYCVRAKNFLNQRSIPFEEVDLTGKHDEIRALKEATHWKTVPQIFINGQLIGGFTDLAALENEGKLTGLLAGDKGGNTDV